MDVLLQLTVLTVSVSLGAIALLVRTARRPASGGRFQVNPVSTSWLADHRTRSRLE